MKRSCAFRFGAARQTLHKGCRTCGLAEPVPGRKPVLALVTRLLWAVTLGLPAVGAQAGGDLTTLYVFESPGGWAVTAGLAPGRDGNLYGMTERGGAKDAGTVFKISINGTLTSLYSFTDGSDGGYPQFALVQGRDGDFYGTTTTGGTNYGSGTVFRISTNGVLTNLYCFTGGADGKWPEAGLVLGADGNFYGTTGRGGTNGGYGTVFKISTNSELTSLYSFSSENNVSGWPNAGLVLGSDGNFYGTRGSDGTNGGYGTVFKISTNGALTSLHSFTGGYDGASPDAGLVQGSDGEFYGTTYGGGTNGGYGTVFKISTNGALTSLYSFTGRADGAYPEGSLAQGRDGNLYGTTSGGAPPGGPGAIFKIGADGVLTTVYSFGGVDGAAPQAGLVQGSDGNLYGTTYGGGGIGGGGTVFRLTVAPSAPIFQSVMLTNGALSLTWSTAAGAAYQLQYNSGLSSSNWTSLGSLLTAAGATLSATDSLANRPRRFYRVVLLP